MLSSDARLPTYLLGGIKAGSLLSGRMPAPVMEFEGQRAMGDDDIGPSNVVASNVHLILYCTCVSCKCEANGT